MPGGATVIFSALGACAAVLAAATRRVPAAACRVLRAEPGRRRGPIRRA